MSDPQRPGATPGTAGPKDRALRRRVATGADSLIVTVVTLAIVAVIYALIEPLRVRIDLSAGQESALMEDTRNKLRLLEQGAGGAGADGAAGAEAETVRITAFSAQEGKKEAYFKNRQLQDLITELDYASPSVEARFVDFDRERLTAEQLGVTEYGTVVIQRGEGAKAQRVDLRDRELFRSVGKGADRTIEFMGESAINRAFSQLMADTSRVVYALVGHGEMDPESPELDGLSELRKALAQENYQLKRLDLVRDSRESGGVPRIPEDAAAVIVARPRVPIPAVEQDLLLAYLAGGGPLLVTVEPAGVTPEVLGRLGVAIPEGRVLDKLLVFPFPDRPVPRYRPHPITQTLSDALLVTVVAGVAPVQASVPPREGVRSATLLETSRDGWIERGGPSDGANAVYQAGIDAVGPAAMAVALEVGKDSGLVRQRSSRVIVLGDSDMIGNGLLPEGPGNLSFAVNALRWLVGDDGRLSVSGRPAQSRKLALTAEDRERIGWVAVGIGPMVAVLLGAAVWSSRRGR